MVSLLLTATESSANRKNPGFMTKGQQLTTTVNPGETIRAVLKRFNQYRQPENVIEKVFSDISCLNPVNLETKPTADLVVYVG
jgi:hypothetical protein